MLTVIFSKTSVYPRLLVTLVFSPFLLLYFSSNWQSRKSWHIMAYGLSAHGYQSLFHLGTQSASIELIKLWTLIKLAYSRAPTRMKRVWDRAPYTEYYQPLFVWLLCDWPSACIYRLYGWIGETIKRKGGVSLACLGKTTSFILDIHNMVNWQLSKEDSHWPLSHDHIAVTWFIWKLSADQLIVLLDRDQCSIPYFLASFEAQENW